MTTPIAHGTYTGYTTHACRCPKCTTAASRYNKHRALQIQRGAWEVFTNPEPVREHLTQLRAAGYSKETIAGLAGVTRDTVGALMAARRSRVRTRVAEKILAIRPSLDDLPELGKVDATGSRRRIQALVAAGWTMTYLAERLGVERSMLHRLPARSTVRVYTARAIRDLFAELCMRRPPQETRYQRAAASRARNQAAQSGWAPALAWDDIDDPKAKPQGVRAVAS